MSDQGGVQPGERKGKDEFVPRGAIAFMILMVLAYSAVWFLFYVLMIGRP